MKKPAIITTEKGVYKFKIKYSTICDLKGLGVDLMSGEMVDITSEPEKLQLIFWKGLEAGEVKKYPRAEANEIFDEIMEDVGVEEFAKMIPEALAIKTNADAAKK